MRWPLLAFALLLAGCDTLSDLVSSKEEPRLEGERYAVLREDTVLKADEGANAAPVDLPVALENDQWPQRGGNAPNYVPNLFAFTGDALTVKDSSDAGEGHKWKTPLVPGAVVVGDLVYSMDSDRHVAARKKDSLGEVVWKLQAGSEDEDPFPGGGLVHGMGVIVVVTGQGHVLAADAKTGEVKWQRRLRLPVRAAPKADGRRLFVKTVDSQLIVLDITDGTLLWEHRGIAEVAGVLAASVPAIDDSMAVVTYASGEVYALDVNTGRDRWRELLTPGVRTMGGSKLTDIAAPPVIADGRVFIGSQAGVLVALQQSNGMRLWERDLPGVVHLWLTGDMLCVLTEDRRLVALSAGNGRIRWIVELPGSGDPESDALWVGGMVLAGKIRVFGQHGEVVTLEPGDGARLSVRDYPKGVTDIPAVAVSTLYAVTQGAKLYKLQ